RAEISDLESAALEGLAKAARDFDPHVPSRRGRRPQRRRSFWSFAFTRILGEMRDELRRFDHLTRSQRAIVTDDDTGELLLLEERLSWINPHEPMPLDANIADGNEQNPRPIAETIEEAHNPT